MTRALAHLTLLSVMVLAVTAGADPTAVSRQLAELRAGSLPDSVDAVVARMLPAARGAADSALVQTLVLERGMTRVAYGRAADGEADLREALTLAEVRRDHASAHKALRYLAEACQHLGRRDESAAVFADLERRARAAGDDFHAGKALYGLGRLRVPRARPRRRRLPLHRGPALPDGRGRFRRPRRAVQRAGQLPGGPRSSTARRPHITRRLPSWRGAAARARSKPWRRTTSPASR